MLQQVCQYLALTCYNKPLSRCIHVACDGLLTGSLLQVAVDSCYPQACSKLFQQVKTSLQMTSCNKYM